MRLFKGIKAEVYLYFVLITIMVLVFEHLV